jgi:hypothetical protein
MAEPSVLATVGSDRSFTLYDIRTGKAERRIIMTVHNQFDSIPLCTDLLLTDAIQRPFVVTYIPDLRPARIRRPQPIHLRRPLPHTTHKYLQSTCRCSDVL